MLLTLVCTATALLVLLLDFKIKNDFLNEVERAASAMGVAYGPQQARRVSGRTRFQSDTYGSVSTGFRGTNLDTDNAGLETKSTNGKIPGSLQGSDDWVVVSGD